MGNEARRFDQVEKSFFNSWIRLHPLQGTALGLHEHDTKLPSSEPQAVQEEIKVLKHGLKEFKAIDPARLSPSRAIDRDLAIHWIQLWLFEREEWRIWESCPEAPRMIGECIFQILSRNYAPLQERLKNILSRMEKLPRYLLQSRERLTRPVKLFVQIELDTITRLPGFFNVLKDVTRDNVSISMQKKVVRAIHHLQEALEQYTDWLIIDVLPQCREEFAIGEERFVRLLRLRGMPESPSRMVSAAESELARLRNSALAIGKKIRKRATLEDIREEIRSQHPSNFDDALKFARSVVNKSKQFVIQTDFATLPSHENLYVIETPLFLRHLMPFGGYCEPARFEPKQDGYYLVTPGDSENDKLKDLNYPSLTNMTVHEAFPGHHLHHVAANAHPSLIRSLGRAPETVEGWALYCEEQVKEIGFEDTPMNRFVHIVEKMWRAARVAIDVKLNTGRMSLAEARDGLMEHAWMDRSAAESEVRRYTTTPTVPLSYTYGRDRIEELKKHARETMKSKYSEKFFHDALLYAGMIPMSFMKRELDWKIKAELAKKPAPPPQPAPAPADPKSKTRHEEKQAKPAQRAAPQPKPKQPGKTVKKVAAKKKTRAKATSHPVRGKSSSRQHKKTWRGRKTRK